MKTIFHATLGFLSFSLILLSMVASIVVESWYSHVEVVEIRTLIFDLFLWLIFLLSLTGVLGISLGKMRGGEIINAKKKRAVWMLFIGALILLPIAYLLLDQARHEQFNLLYFALQFIEYAFEIVLLVLLGLNIKDGGKLVRQSQGIFDSSSV